MAEQTNIEWTDATWNPVTGCSIVSPGCRDCYAMHLAATRLRNHASRKGLTNKTKVGPVWNGKVRLNEAWLTQPLRWNKPRRIFVCAHGDLFHENVPDAWIDKVFAVMALSPQHTFQVLTKRAERMRAYMTDAARRRIYTLVCDMVTEEGVADVVLIAPFHDPNLAPPGPRIFLDQWPLPNVWLGVSAERQKEADERIPLLLQTPAAKRFVSAEPLLGPIDLNYLCPEPYFVDALHGRALSPDDPDGGGAGEAISRLDWVIVGGESGKTARPMHPDWARSLRDQCKAAGVAFFFKQWGEWLPGHHFSPELLAADDEDNSRFDCMDWENGKAVESSGTWDENVDEHACWRVGKKAAGRLLDGVEHSEWPK